MEESIKRAIEMLQVVAVFFEENPICQEYTTVYDEEECDGGCIRDDCQNAAAALEMDFARSKMP